MLISVRNATVRGSMTVAGLPNSTRLVIRDGRIVWHTSSKVLRNPSVVGEEGGAGQEEKPGFIAHIGCAFRARHVFTTVVLPGTYSRQTFLGAAFHLLRQHTAHSTHA